MCRNFIVSIILTFIISINCLQANNKPQLLDSIEVVLSKSPKDTVILNSLLRKLNNPAIRNLPTTDSIANVILNTYKNIGYSDGAYNAMLFLANLNYTQGNFKQALSYHHELLKSIEDKNDNRAKVANIYKFLTGDHLNLGSFDSAIIYGELSLNEYKILSDSQNIARSLNLLGGIYWNKGNLKKASEILYESLIIREKLNDTLGVANAYNNIGLIFDSQKKYPEALEMYQKALDIYYKINNRQGIGRACNNIAIIQKNQGKYSESLEMFMKSLEVDKFFKNIDDQGKTLSNIGILYLELNDVSRGIEYFNYALEALTQSGNENGVAAVYINLGRAYLMKNNYSKAEYYYNMGLKIANKIGSNEWQRDSYHGLYKISKSTNKLNNAIVYLEKYKNLDDSLRSVENLNKLDQLKIEFETEQKEKELALLYKEKEVNDLKLKRQQSVTHLLLTIIVSSILIIFLASLYVHRLKTDKRVLVQKNAEITQQKEEIMAQRDMLEESNIELNQQKEELLTQSEQIERQNQFISGINRRMTEGLEYASIIQQTLLPSTSSFNKFFGSQFVLFKPKDIVSGDLYWTWEEKGEIIFAVADCTGHGVAGAFMSVMAISLLKDAVSVNKFKEPHTIANYLYNELVRSSNSELNSIVGIDFIICKYSPKNRKLSYCGNHMNFLVAKKENVELFKVKRTVSESSQEIRFEENSLDLDAKDKLYFYTDGYTDQLSGVKRKKMGRAEFHRLISTICIQPHQSQSETIESFYNKWKGNFEQVDDVLVLGLEV